MTCSSGLYGSVSEGHHQAAAALGREAEPGVRHDAVVQEEEVARLPGHRPAAVPLRLPDPRQLATAAQTEIISG